MLSRNSHFMFQNNKQDMNIEFPANYPTSCLLGYVDLTDCLSADFYKKTVKIKSFKTFYYQYLS
jgi:hypothetical protein